MSLAIDLRVAMYAMKAVCALGYFAVSQFYSIEEILQNTRDWMYGAKSLFEGLSVGQGSSGV